MEKKMVKLTYIVALCTVVYCYQVKQGKEEKSNRMKNDELDKLLKEVVEEKIHDEYLDRQDDDDENSDEFYEKAEHALEKKSPFLFGRRRRRSCPSAPSRSRCNVGLRYNGCGSDIFNNAVLNTLNAGYKTTLEAACNKHDICYNCGSTKGWSQSECDDRFYSDSKKVCDCKFKQWYQAFEKGKCHGAALAMYGIVKAAGSNFYLSSSHDYCNGNSCINDFSEGTSIF